MQLVRQRLRLYAFAGAAATTLVASPAGTDGFGMMKLLTLFLFSSTCGVMAVPLLGGAWRARRGALLAAGAFVLALFLVLCIDGGNYFQSVYGVFGRANGLLGYLSLTVMLLIVAIGFEGPMLPSLLTALVSTGVLVGVYGTVQTLGHDPVDWQRSYENPLIGTFGNPDFSAAFLGLAGVAALALAVDASWAPRLRAPAMIVTVWLVWLAWRTTTIQGLLAFAVGCSVMLAVWLGSPERPSWLGRLRLPYLSLLAAGGTLFALGIANRGPLASRLFDSSVEQRLYTWQAALNMFRARPFAGVGLEAYGDWYPTVRTPESIRIFGQGMFSNEGHSVLLTLLGTGGLLLAVPYVGLWLFVGWRALQLSRQASGLATAGLIAVWVAYLVDTLFSMDQLGVAVWGWLFAGAVLAAGRPAPPDSVPQARPSRAAMLARGAAVAGIAALVLAVGLFPLLLDLRITRAEALPVHDARSRAAAVSALLEVADRTPEPVRLVSIANRLQEIGAAPQALALALRAAARFPGEVTVWRWIAQYYEHAGQGAMAVTARRHIALLNPLDPDNSSALARDREAAATS